MGWKGNCGCGWNVSAEGEGRNVSEEGEERNVSEEGEERNVSAEGEGRNVSEEGEERNVSEEGEERNVSAEWEGRNVSAEGREGNVSAETRNVSAEGEGRNVSAEGEGRNVSAQGRKCERGWGGEECEGGGEECERGGEECEVAGGRNVSAVREGRNVSAVREGRNVSAEERNVSEEGMNVSAEGRKCERGVGGEECERGGEGRECERGDEECERGRGGEECERAGEEMLWRGVVRRGDTVVDATCGNGHDSMAMAALALAPAPPSDGEAGSAGEEVRGRVVAMDIQEEAVSRTHRLLAAGLSDAQMAHVHTVCACHSTLLHHVAPGSARLVAFNLGYLPRAHHAPPTTVPSPTFGPEGITTQPGSTVAALQAAVAATAVGGVVSVMAYVGHPGGREEYDAVVEVAASLPADSWPLVPTRASTAGQMVRCAIPAEARGEGLARWRVTGSADAGSAAPEHQYCTYTCPCAAPSSSFPPHPTHPQWGFLPSPLHAIHAPSRPPNDIPLLPPDWLHEQCLVTNTARPGAPSASHSHTTTPRCARAATNNAPPLQQCLAFPPDSKTAIACTSPYNAYTSTIPPSLD
ncbi:unnamed protein product [Closterium sp. Naga37s-1]|nr:unnamed protein product [Closterium sp. Naga37s-1]